MRRFFVLAVLFLTVLAHGRVALAAAPSVETMAGAMIMTGFSGTRAPASVRRAVAEGRLGGIILFDRGLKVEEKTYNIESASQLRRMIAELQAAAPHTLLVAVDQEGGRVRRLKKERGFFPLPSAAAMGSMDTDEVRRLGLRAGREMAALGINVDLAPVVDVRRSKRSPGLGDADRLFGSDASAVARKALAFADGLYEAGVIPALKHFPGLGSASSDSHKDLPDVTRHWSEEELLPYKEAFRRGWKGMVLVGHVYHRGLDGELPSSLSAFVIEGLLRRRMGWDGVVISDDLQMGAVTGRTLEERVLLALNAGNDILLFGNHLDYDPELHNRIFQAVMDLVHRGKVSRERLETSWRRIERMKLGLAARQ